MTSPAMTGFWGGIGQGLSILGQQGLQDRSEQARIQMLNDLQIARDEKEMKFRSAESAKDRSQRANEVATNATLTQMGWANEDARAAADRAARANQARLDREASIKVAGMRQDGKTSEKLAPQAQAVLDGIDDELKSVRDQEAELSKSMYATGSDGVVPTVTPEQKAQMDRLEARRLALESRRIQFLSGDAIERDRPEDAPKFSMPTTDRLMRVPPEMQPEYVQRARSAGATDDDIAAIMTKFQGINEANVRTPPASVATERPAATPNILGGETAASRPAESAPTASQKPTSTILHDGTVRKVFVRLMQEEAEAGKTAGVGRGKTTRQAPNIDYEIRRLSALTKRPEEEIRRAYEEFKSQ